MTDTNGTPEGYTITTGTVTDSYSGVQNTAWYVTKAGYLGYKFAQPFWSEENAMKAIAKDARMDARLAEITPEQEAVWERRDARAQAIEDADEDNQ